MGLEGIGRLPAQKKLCVGSAVGPTSYAVGGIPVRLPINTLISIYDIIAVWQHPNPLYELSVGSWVGNTVYVKLGCPYGASCSSELPSCTDVSDVSVFVAGMGR